MIVVHHLNESRSQRVLWLLEELGREYEIQFYTRDSSTRFAPPELAAIHPLGKSPVIVDGDTVIHESGAIIDYLVRKYGSFLQPDPDSPDYERYVQWLHYAEGSAMLPLLLKLYVDRIGDAGAPLHPRITSELTNHLGYVESSLEGRRYLLGEQFSAADVQMSFVGELAGVYGLRHDRPNLDGWINRLHGRPAYRAAIRRGGQYSLSR
ncbi:MULTISPECIES: glutathione S-transferase family protein [Burkholderiaceae]|uniref:glutathione S-transferase family protein n=1 Tax=Burkholderiaceae TaxID=119060 RepID=UPI000E982E11|nr:MULTISPECIES: glutathione S-transferase [Burkholderiaceae]HBD37819.1 glutathione S-transferase [Cupriavidus sp.]KAB0600536.1 glutathione S-transferase [Cupriavidus pauculus]MBR8163302.1 glutathione S-transferase [Burkholderia vietnamiensis]MCA7943003.1 glutathione S-transferase [Burkholderia vietnamiensis]MCA8148842.1 glutathione S-transferase [Burkholderia vietnamiensis]